MPLKFNLFVKNLLNFVGTVYGPLVIAKKFYCLCFFLGCTAYDVVINPAFYTKLQNSELFNSFFLTIVFEGLESKYDIELERTWTILKNKKCMGVLHPHCIRSKRKPVIMEMEEEFKSSAPEGQNNVFSW